MKRPPKILLYFLIVLVGVVLFISQKAFLLLGDHSFDAKLSSSHLAFSVKVSWDKYAVPQIKAMTTEDAYFVQGFVTARDRFFQMDLTRRKMAGTLTELFGPKALASDKKSRQWNFSNTAKEAFELMSSDSKDRLGQYAAGVNTFLRTSPHSWEYLLLRRTPQTWTPEDSFLVVLSMYDSLNRHDSPSEQNQAILKSASPPPLYQFLNSEGGFFDTPIIKDTDNPQDVSVPDPGVFTVSSEFKFDPTTEMSPQTGKERDKEPGSNAWVISGKLSQTGKPILASDPHLDLRIPNLWYRVELSTPDFNVRGVTIPGIPGVVIGRNNKVAWAFTNSAVDNSDHVFIDTSSAKLTLREESFLLPDGTVLKEVFQDSDWGPVFSQPNGSSYAIHWSALDPHNLKTLDLSHINSAKNTKEFLAAMRNWAGPVQNLIFATSTGDIGWTLVGKIPNRNNYDGQLPLTLRKHNLWRGYLDQDQLPLVINPETGFIVNANQRTVPLSHSYKPFGHHWPNATRARRITERLENERKLSIDQMESIQNDNVSLTHLFYRDKLTQCLKTMDEAVTKEPSFEQSLQSWKGHTHLDSKVFSFLREFRFEAMNTFLIPISWTLSRNHFRQLTKELSRDDLIKKIIDSKAKHLLAPQFQDHCDALIFAFQRTLKKFAAEKIEQIPPWGQINKSKIEHPFSRLLPGFLKPLLNFPQEGMAGDYLVPRVMTPNNGASMRLIMDLGTPHLSLFSQPGGQSSRPLSKYYRGPFSSWINGQSIPFEAEGETQTELFSPSL